MATDDSTGAGIAERGPMETWLLDTRGPFTFNENPLVADDLLHFAREQDARLAAFEGHRDALYAALEVAVSTIEQLIPESSARGVADVVLAQARTALAQNRAK